MITHRMLQRGVGSVLMACALLVGPSAVAGVAFPADVLTHVRDASNNDVTGGSLTPGTVVHDVATVTRSAGTPSEVPDPTGNVDFILYDNGTCNGLVIATDPGTPLLGGTATSANFTTPSAGGTFSYRAHYSGDANYEPGDGACEAFTVVANVASVVTHVRDAANNDLTGSAVSAGTVVHDEATVARAVGTPAGVPDPTGSVGFTLCDNGTCNGNVVAIDPSKPLAGGTATSATFTTPSAGGTFSYRAHYGGDGNYGPGDGACESFTTQVGQLTPTNVECADVLAGTAPTLGQINYSVFAGKIALSLNPGAFVFWTKITTTVPNQVVTVSQSNTSTNNAAPFTVLQAWDRLYTANCGKWKAGTLIGSGTGASFTVPTPGTYFIGLKYQTKSLAGTAPPIPADIIYNFSTSLGLATGGSVPLKKAH